MASSFPSEASAATNPAPPSPPHTLPGATDTARTYYDSHDADTFYRTIWGGTDIHVGLYSPSPSPSSSSSSSSTTSIATASHATILHLSSLLQPPPTSRTHILDLGSGYGGAARYLARTYGCNVTCLNLSEVENRRNRETNREEGLEGLVRVVEGSFESVPLEEGSVDVVWSQDALLHAGDRGRVVEEVVRILRKEGGDGDGVGGRVVFTDPMMVAGKDGQGALVPILKRLHLQNLGSVEFYQSEFAKRGFTEMKWEDRTDMLVVHYGRVLQELEAREEDLKGKISDEYVRNMKMGLRHWVEGGRSGQLCWGILQFWRGGRGG